jgi:hypothetical protein
MQKLDGFFPVCWDERTSALWREVPRFDADVLYVTGLASDLGSNVSVWIAESPAPGVS